MVEVEDHKDTVDEDDELAKPGFITANRKKRERDFYKMFGRHDDDKKKDKAQKQKRQQPQPQDPGAINVDTVIDDLERGISFEPSEIHIVQPRSMHT